jgi:hypothetical protein
MKKAFPVFLFACLTLGAAAQKVSKPDSLRKESAVTQKKFSCDTIDVNFETGLLNNKVGPASPIDSVKKYLPCVTYEIPFGSEDKNCGGGAVMEKQGIFFNLEHGFIEFTPNTTAHLPMQVFGVLEDDLTAITDEPSQVTDLHPYSDRPIQSVYLYPKSYGCVAIWVDQKDRKVFKVQLHNQPPASAFLCVE